MSLRRALGKLPARPSPTVIVTFRTASTSTSAAASSAASPDPSSSSSAPQPSASSAPPTLTNRQRQQQQAWSEMLTKVSERRARRYTDSQLAHLGSTQDSTSQYRPRDSLHFPPTSLEATTSHLVASGAHLGHSTTLTHRAALPLIYGTRTGISYIDLRQTLPALRRAAEVVRGVVERDGIVVFVGSLKGTEAAVWRNAQRLGENGYAVTKWLPGTISNAREVFKHSEIPRDDSSNARAPKPTPTSFKPDLIVLLSPTLNEHAVREATANEVPTIGITDTDIDPRSVTYSIPANDDSPRTVELIAGVLGMAGKDGLARKKQRQALEARRLARRSEGASQARRLGSYY